VTVSIHTVLYVRKIYPQELFMRARKYNTPVYQCRHPDVCTWVNDAIQGVGEELKKVTTHRPMIREWH
jgi:mitotic spindle assembly checkpoint protein MAD2B